MDNSWLITSNKRTILPLLRPCSSHSKLKPILETSPLALLLLHRLIYINMNLSPIYKSSFAKNKWSQLIMNLISIKRPINNQCIISLKASVILKVLRNLSHLNRRLSMNPTTPILPISTSVKFWGRLGTNNITTILSKSISKNLIQN